MLGALFRSRGWLIRCLPRQLTPPAYSTQGITIIRKVKTKWLGFFILHSSWNQSKISAMALPYSFQTRFPHNKNNNYDVMFISNAHTTLTSKSTVLSKRFLIFPPDLFGLDGHLQRAIKSCL